MSLPGFQPSAVFARRVSPQVLLVIALSVVLAVFAGFLAVSGSIFLIAGFLGAVVGFTLLFSPNLLFATSFLFSLVIAGLAEFYLGIGQANWIASGLAVLLWGAALLTRFGVSASPPASLLQMPGLGLLIGLYASALVLSSVLSQISTTQFVVGVRNYLPFIGIFLALRYAVSRQWLDNLPAALVGVGLLQLPFCLHQLFVVGARRKLSGAAVGGEAEAVVGTFGGDPMGGGYTGEMAVFVLLAACVALAVYGAGPKRWVARAVPVAALACVALAETKIVFVLTPFVLLLVFWEEIKARPSRLVVLGFGLLVGLGTLASVYAWRFWAVGGFAEFLHAFTYSFDPDFMVTDLHRGRVGTLIHWWDINPGSGRILETLFGYGLASTLEASRVLGEGNAVQQFGPGLDAHAASKLLWDVGVVGFVLFCWILLRTALIAHRLVAWKELPAEHRGMVKVARAAMFAFAAMLPYQVSIVGGAPMQLLFWFFVGYVAYWRARYVGEV